MALSPTVDGRAGAFPPAGQVCCSSCGRRGRGALGAADRGATRRRTIRDYSVPLGERRRGAGRPRASVSEVARGNGVSMRCAPASTGLLASERRNAAKSDARAGRCGPGTQKLAAAAVSLVRSALIALIRRISHAGDRRAGSPCSAHGDRLPAAISGTRMNRVGPDEIGALQAVVQSSCGLCWRKAAPDLAASRARIVALPTRRGADRAAICMTGAAAARLARARAARAQAAACTRWRLQGRLAPRRRRAGERGGRTAGDWRGGSIRRSSPKAGSSWR